MISVVTIISNAVRLDYPIQPWFECNEPVASEIVINVDSNCQDGTMELVQELARRSNKVKILESPWNWENRVGGTELAIQTNLAIEVCTQPWVLYAQADEVLHEQQHSMLRFVAQTAQQDIMGFDLPRLYFWGNPKTIRVDWSYYLPRLFRKGSRVATGDAMYTGGDGLVDRCSVTLFHYSRMGDRSIISKRIATLDGLFHPQETIRNPETYEYEVRSFDSFSSETSPVVVPGNFAQYAGTHPTPMVRWFQSKGLWDESL